MIVKTINDKKKSLELDHGAQLAGMVTQEFKLEQNFMEEVGWGRFLGNVKLKFYISLQIILYLILMEQKMIWKL